MKKTIRLTESDLHNIIEEAVKTALNEIGDSLRGQYYLGRLAGNQKYNDDYEAAERTKQYAQKNGKNQYNNWGEGQNAFKDGQRSQTDLNYAIDSNNALNNRRTNKMLAKEKEYISDTTQMYPNKKY